MKEGGMGMGGGRGEICRRMEASKIKSTFLSIT